MRQFLLADEVHTAGYVETRYLAPVLDTFMRALPHTYRSVEAREGTIIDVTISGNRKGTRGATTWGVLPAQTQRFAIPQEIAWKLFTKWITKEEAVKVSDVRGDSSLVLRVFHMTAVIA